LFIPAEQLLSAAAAFPIELNDAPSGAEEAENN